MRLILITSLVAASLLQGFGQSPVGEWQMSVAQSVQLMDAGSKARYDGLPADVRQTLDQRFDQREFVFNSDGSGSISWATSGDQHVVQASWTQNGTVLTIVAEGRTNQYTVSQATETTLVLSTAASAGIFTQLYLNRKP